MSSFLHENASKTLSSNFNNGDRISQQKTRHNPYFSRRLKNEFKNSREETSIIDDKGKLKYLSFIPIHIPSALRLYPAV